MANVFGFLKFLLTAQTTITDSLIFRLHYKLTLPVMVICGFIIICCQYFGDPIHCMSSDDTIPTKLLDTYCWSHGTFLIKDAWSKKVGQEVPYPGIDLYSRGEKKIYNNFYQWVGFILLIQAIFFYIPHFIWKCRESRQINKMIWNLNNTVYGLELRDANKQILSEYFISLFNRHMCYWISYFICELLNLINVFIQTCIIHACLFSSHEIKKPEDWPTGYDMLKGFPRLAKCTFHRYGSSGDIQKHDAMCTLNFNVLNEKIYFFLWVWFIILSILSCMAVTYRILLVVIPNVRASILLMKARQPQEEHINAILRNCNIGDWFLLDLMCTNLDPVNFRDVIHDIAVRICGKEFIDI